MSTLSQKLKQNIAQKQTTETPLFGMRNKIIDTVREELNKWKTDIMQELREIMEEKLGEEGLTTLKGERGYTPQRGIDFLTPEEMQQIKRELKPKDGKQGKDGKDGRDADIFETTNLVLKKLPKMEADEIAEKLNTLKDVLEIDLIKGLKEFINKNMPKPRLGGGGGGMGQPQHEVKNISAGTVSITTTYPIAANGKAIFNFTYNNANLEMTNHYTVGTDNKTITFSAGVQAQFENGQTVSITYIRG